MDNKLHSLEEVVDALYCVSLGGINGINCAGGTNGINDTDGTSGADAARRKTPPAECSELGKLYVAGADFYAADKKLLLKLYSDAPLDTGFERARLYLAEIFGCSAVELSFIRAGDLNSGDESGSAHGNNILRGGAGGVSHNENKLLANAGNSSNGIEPGDIMPPTGTYGAVAGLAQDDNAKIGHIDGVMPDDNSAFAGTNVILPDNIIPFAGSDDASPYKNTAFASSDEIMPDNIIPFAGSDGALLTDNAPATQDSAIVMVSSSPPLFINPGKTARKKSGAATGRSASSGRSTANGRGSSGGRGAASRKKADRDKIRAGFFDKSMAGIDFEDGEYFIQHPDVICGIPITAEPVSMGNMAFEQQERVTVRGEIVTVACRAIKSGETNILEFGISDGSGSITVKMFVPPKFLDYIQPKLVIGGEIIVYGELQMDAYLKEQALYAIDINKLEPAPHVDDAAVKRVELHLHTQMSALDAVAPVGKLVQRAAQFGHPAVAITDHGVVQAFPDAYTAGKTHKIKIIYGVEAYLEPEPYHIIILAKNQTGLKNLYKLISISHLDYFYKHPRMPRREIEKYREGLIVGSACEAGELYTAVAAKKPREELLGIAAFYDYLEIQPVGNNMFMLRGNAVGSVEELWDYNRTIVDLGDELDKPVAATCDVHFLNMADEVFRRILMSGQNYKDADIQPPLYLRATPEMLGEFAYLGEEKAYEVVVENTNLINGWIDDDIKPIPEGTFTPTIEGADEELRQIVEVNAKKLYGDEPPSIIRERIDRELEIIISKNFSVLYMIAQRLVKQSNDDGYIVGSRGSVGSSLVAAIAGITDVNPLPPHYLCGSCKYFEISDDKSIESGFDLPDKLCPRCGALMAQDGQDIMFEIFIGAKGQEKAPDIDLNFSGEYQLRAHKYTEEIFGVDNVFKAGTIGTIANKTAYGFVKKYLESKEKTPGKVEEERLTRGCTGVKRTTGQHPGGLIVVPHDKEIFDFTPIQHPADADDTDIVTTHFDFNALKETILKLDLLGHDDPSMIKMLEDLTGVKSDTIRMHDPGIMSLFNGTSALGVTPEDIGSPVGTAGLPEFGTRFIRQMLIETKPRSFSDLLQISGLSHGTNVWLNNAQELIRKGTCTISEVIGTRESLVLYLMNHGLEQAAAYHIMEAVRNKNKNVSDEQEKLMAENGVPAWYIESCKKIEYLFTKAHATAYVLMAYRQAWYKINKPFAFYAAYFTIRADEFDAETMTRGAEKAKLRLSELDKLGRAISPREQKIQTILEVVVEMYARGIKFMPVDIYESDAAKFTIEEDGIRPPLSSLAGLGGAAAENICAARKGKPFISIDDIVARSKITKTVVETLRAYGALEGLPDESQISLYDIINMDSI